MRSKSFWNVNKKGQMSSSSSWSREHTRFSSIKDATIISIYIIFQNLATLGGSPLSLSLVAIGFLRRLNSLDRTKYIITYFVKSVEAVEDSYLQFGSNFFASL